MHFKSIFIEFSLKDQLNKLNNLVWPAILEEAKKQINSLYERGINIIVMEAAVLIQANWQPYCHEIWTCIIPEEEVSDKYFVTTSVTSSSY